MYSRRFWEHSETFSVNCRRSRGSLISRKGFFKDEPPFKISLLIVLYVETVNAVYQVNLVKCLVDRILVVSTSEFVTVALLFQIYIYIYIYPGLFSSLALWDSIRDFLLFIMLLFHWTCTSILPSHSSCLKTSEKERTFYTLRNGFQFREHTRLPVKCKIHFDLVCTLSETRWIKETHLGTFACNVLELILRVFVFCLRRIIFGDTGKKDYQIKAKFTVWRSNQPWRIRHIA